MTRARNRLLILASSSPRRRHLLTAAGLEFQVVAPDVSEVMSAALSIAEITTCNAQRKAALVARLRPDAVVIGADTLVALDGEVMGKPADLAEAARILRRLSGREHQVCTSVAIVCAARGRARSFSVISQVQFHRLSESRIQKYIAKVGPLDKAGAYAAQGEGAEIIARVHGSYSNVIGLPMEETARALRQFGQFAPRA